MRPFRGPTGSRTVHPALGDGGPVRSGKVRTDDLRPGLKPEVVRLEDDGGTRHRDVTNTTSPTPVDITSPTSLDITTLPRRDLDRTQDGEENRE